MAARVASGLVRSPLGFWVPVWPLRGHGAATRGVGQDRVPFFFKKIDSHVFQASSNLLDSKE